jgi:polysaccharide biosynthesis transport protein
MNSSLDTGLNPVEVARSLRTHVRWWVVPTVVCAGVAAAYSLVASRDWRATQALIVRPEAASVSHEQIGKFSDLSEMKTLQETILELAKSQSVVEATLKEVGPTGWWPSKSFPTLADVEAFREQIDMRPPGGAEFGKTEVFYLSVLDTNRDRARALATALCGQLEQRMQRLRDQRAQGMIAELQRTVAMADQDLAAKTKELSAFEAAVGSDLAELRNLNATTGAQSEVSQVLQGIEAERRANDAARRENQQLLKVLQLAQQDPEQLLATPTSLLRSQPAVSRLKDAVVDAQVNSANLLASKSEKHPFVIAAREAETLVRQKLNDEVAVAIKGVEIELAMNADREASLAARGEASRDRVGRLAGARVEYANLIAAVDNHAKLVDAARKNLADARALQAGAKSASVISRIDGVEAGVRPVGASRKTITAAGGFGGLVLGLGFVFLFAKPVPPKSSVTPGVSNGSPVTAAPVQTESVNGVVAVVSEKQNGGSTKDKPRDFGLFHGLSLDQAIRRVEQRFSDKSGW